MRAMVISSLYKTIPVLKPQTFQTAGVFRMSHVGRVDLDVAIFRRALIEILPKAESSSRRTPSALVGRK